MNIDGHGSVVNRARLQNTLPIFLLSTRVGSDHRLGHPNVHIYIYTQIYIDPSNTVILIRVAP